MSFFKTSELPSCCNCRYADYYPAPFWFRFLDPYCRIHKVKCDVDMVCMDFELIGRNSR